MRVFVIRDAIKASSRHCEEGSDEAIQPRAKPAT
jgi:hypothetical protein